LNGEPLVRRAARTYIDAGLTPLVAVVSDRRLYDDALAGLALTVVENRDPEQGLSHSIALGLSAVPADANAVLLGVADQPFLSADGIRELCRAYQPCRIVMTRYGDHRGNPCIFDRHFFPELMAIRGDHGGGAVVRAHRDAVIEVQLPDRMGTDIDRPEDWPAPD
jgi:molybdenum cofactor cytidylyltransferase